MQIPFFRYPHVFEQHRSVIERVFMETASRGGYIMQRELCEFEERLAEYCGTGYAVGVGNATDGLELIVRLAGVGVDDEVLLVSHTFVATAAAVVVAGAKPVFAEVGEDHLINPSDIEHRITERTRAIMPTQLNGRTADMEAVCAIAARHSLAVIEDSAQGLGSKFCGRMAGTFGIAGVFSFYPAKNLGCLGDGGAIIVDDQGAAQVLRELRDHGRNEETGDVMRWGRNTRLDNLQATVLLTKLARYSEEISRRRELADRYHQGLNAVPQLHLPPPPDHSAAPQHFDVFQNYEVEAEGRDNLRAFLKEHGIGTVLQWGGKAVHQFTALGLTQALPKTEGVMSSSVLFPMNTSLTDEEVDYITARIREYYGG